MNDNKMITQSRIIEEYGWTKSLISKFLPDPVLKANPHYRNQQVKQSKLSIAI